MFEPKLATLLKTMKKPWSDQKLILFEQNQLLRGQQKCSHMFQKPLTTSHLRQTQTWKVTE